MPCLRNRDPTAAAIGESLLLQLKLLLLKEINGMGSLPKLLEAFLPVAEGIVQWHANKLHGREVIIFTTMRTRNAIKPEPLHFNSSFLLMSRRDHIPFTV